LSRFGKIWRAEQVLRVLRRDFDQWRESRWHYLHCAIQKITFVFLEILLSEYRKLLRGRAGASYRYPSINLRLPWILRPGGIDSGRRVVTALSKRSGYCAASM
jgi:hypothetical protein